MKDEYTGIVHNVYPRHAFHNDAEALPGGPTLLCVEQLVSNHTIRHMYVGARNLLNSLLMRHLAGAIEERYIDRVVESLSEDTLLRGLRLHVMTQETYDVLMEQAHQDGYKAALNDNMFIEQRI